MEYSPEISVYAYAAAQVKKAMEVRSSSPLISTLRIEDNLWKKKSFVEKSGWLWDK